MHPIIQHLNLILHISFIIQLSLQDIYIYYLIIAYYEKILMKREFIAYDLDSHTLLRLKEYSYISKIGIRKNYLMDKNKNFVFNPELNKAFET